MNDFYLLADCHSRRAPYDDPMFRAVMMQLQRQAAAGFDDDALDLEAIALIDRLIGAPRTMNLKMRLGNSGRHFL